MLRQSIITLKTTFIIVISSFCLLSIINCQGDQVEDPQKLKSDDSQVREDAVSASNKMNDPRTVEHLIADLKDKDANVRWEAAKALRDIKDPRAVEPLITALKDKDADVRWKAAEALGEIKDPRAIEPLSVAIKDKDWGIREKVAKVLGKIKNPRAVEPLIAALKDRDMHVRRAAAKALGEIKDLRAVEPLIVALKDSGIGAEALEKIGWSPKNTEQRVFYLIAKDKWGNKWSEISKIGKPAVEPLIAALKDREADVRWKAARALGDIKDPRAIEPLIIALKDKDVRGMAAEALGKIKDPRAVEPLITALKDKDAYVRGEVADALVEINDSMAINPLIQNLTDWYSNRIASEVLSRLGWKPQSDEHIIHFLVAQRKGEELRNKWSLTKNVLLKDIESKDYRTIENALYAFIGIGKDEIIPTLIKTLKQKGNKTMAEAFLNCGHKELIKAAEEWAVKHGYIISKGSGHYATSWGYFK